MISVGDEVRINHEGDKDDGAIGTVIEISGDRFLVRFDQGGGWYERSEIERA